ncbi:unnamed protein product, partial [Pocillopora meandrina]
QFFLHPTKSNDFEAKYNLERSRCHRNPKNYMEDKINITKCNVSFSGACWPEITAGSTFIQPCPSLFFTTGGLIHRRCNASGHWERMNISQCRKLESSQVLNNMKESSCDLLNTTTVCTGVWILNRYFAVAEVTWMTNEAVFLLRLLIRAFDNESYFWYYFFFGWGQYK